MKKLFVALLMPISVVMMAWGFTGCSKKLGTQPNYGPIIATNTPVPANTSTFTITPTPTVTPTVTATPTGPFTPPPTSTPTATATITLTPVSTPAGSTFNSAGSVAPWAVNTGSSTAGNTAATGIGFNSGFSGCAASTGAMEVTMGFTAVNQAVYVQDQLASPADMSGKTITAILEVNGGWNSDSEQIYGSLFVQQGGTAGTGTAYASLYTPGTGLYNSNSTAGSSGCVTFTVTMPGSTTPTGSYANYNIYSGPFDPSEVGYWGIQIGTGGGGNTFAPTILDVQSWLYQ